MWTTPAGDPKQAFLCKFVDFFRFSSIFRKNTIFTYGNWVRMTREWSRIYLEIVLELGTVSKIWIWVSKLIFQIFGTLIFQFSSKTQFWGQYFEDLSCRICSYGLYGPFRFSVKKWFDPQISINFPLFWKKSLFEITV